MSTACEALALHCENWRDGGADVGRRHTFRYFRRSNSNGSIRCGGTATAVGRSAFTARSRGSRGPEQSGRIRLLAHRSDEERDDARITPDGGL